MVFLSEIEPTGARASEERAGCERKRPEAGFMTRQYVEEIAPSNYQLPEATIKTDPAKWNFQVIYATLKEKGVGTFFVKPIPSEH